MRQKLFFEGTFVRGGADMPFRHLPFNVPPGATRLEVSYHFARAAEQPVDQPQDVVDIGVFDARGADFLSGGFRGWSGSARRVFHITPQDATPGYIRGPLIPGEWQLFLGCRIAHSEQCPYWVHLTLDVEPVADDDIVRSMPEMKARAKRKRAKRDGPGRWYKGDFHSHTEHSDGLNSIDEYARAAQNLGLDFLAITDHNTSSHYDEIARRKPGGALLIPGEEVTTGLGHANVWGTNCWVDFRCTDDQSMQQVVDFVYEKGGLFSVNHPKVSAGYPWEFTKVQGFRTMEVWQGVWRYFNTESLNLWERHLRAGDRVVAVGGSDAHSIPPAEPMQPWTLGDPCTWVYVRGALDEEGILDAVRAGHVFVSQDPKGPFLELTASCNGKDYLMGDTIDAPAGTPVRLRLRYQGGSEKKLRLLRNGDVWREVVADQEDVALEYDVPVERPEYLRAEVTGYRGRPERGEVVHALTNPLYVQPAGS